MSAKFRMPETEPQPHAESNGKPKRKRHPDGIAAPEAQTDIANAERFASKFGDRVRFVAEWNRFIVHAGTHWREDFGQVQCRRFAKAVAKAVWAEVGANGSATSIKFAQRTASRGGLAAMVHVAGADLTISPQELDADPWALNCINGTVNLRTGELRPHERTDYLTKLCPVPFDPAATCPRWEQTLHEVFVSSALVAFVQRLFGYFLTGDVSEQILAIFHGCGANGKTTTLKAFQDVLGDYAGQAPAALLTVKKTEQHPTEIAGLFGKRFVVATETEGGARLAESLVKQLTGGDAITARRMREDFWTFNPTHKLVLCTNYKPRIRGQDHAIWRRLLLVPFSQVFGDGRKDPRLPDKLKAEAPGILAWAVRGCLAWQQDGLQPPEEVRAATREYRSSEDVVGQFVRDCCAVGSSEFTVKFSELYTALERWCEDTGNSRPGKKTVAQWLQDNGLEQYHSGVVRYRGIGLADL